MPQALQYHRQVASRIVYDRTLYCLYASLFLLTRLVRPNSSVISTSPAPSSPQSSVASAGPLFPRDVTS